MRFIDINDTHLFFCEYLFNTGVPENSHILWKSLWFSLMGDFIEHDARPSIGSLLAEDSDLMVGISFFGKCPEDLIKITVRPISSKAGPALSTFTFIRGLDVTLAL